MNRHNKFYAELAGKMNGDYDDDYYEEEEEEYYEDMEEEGEYYEDMEEDATTQQASSATTKIPTLAKTNGSVVAAAPPKVTPPKHTAFSVEDADYDLLDSMVPLLFAKWDSTRPIQLPLTEAEATEALREVNYDVDAAVQLWKGKRAAQKAKSGPTVLKVVSAKPKAVAGGAGNGAQDEGRHDSSDDAGETEVAPSGATSGTLRLSRHQHTAAEVGVDTSKPDCTFVIAGHVDAGKSTTLGHLLVLLGKVSEADVERNEKAARKLHKESFKYAWLLDQSEEERRRGVTIDSGSFCFETPHRRVHILDAPGHKDFVLSMISSATQADAALLVVTAAVSEFETGLAHGTKDHLLVLKTLGVGSIVVAVNKMDSVTFDKNRYDYVVQELKLLFKQMRLREEIVMGFCPMSGMTGTNIVTVDKTATPWYDGPSLVELIDRCPLESRLVDGPLRLSLQDVQGSTLYTKVESGKLRRGDTVHFVPCDVKVAVKSIDKPTVGGTVSLASAGDTIEIKTNSSLINLYPGSVGCEPGNLVKTSTDFEAIVQTFGTLAKSILPGATFTLIVHALTVRVKVILLVSKMDNKGNWSSGMVKCIPANAQAMIVFRAENRIALEPAEECRALGRFVLQQDGETVAGGLVKRIIVQG